MKYRNSNMKFHLPPRTAQGFSLIELMVAMTLSLILLGGVLAIFSSSRTTYETTDRLSRIQESGRFALDSIARDVRSAGYVGCSRNAPFTNALKNSTSVLWNFANAIQGYDALSSSWSPTLDTVITNANAQPGNDVLVVRIPRFDARAVSVMSDLASTTSNVTLDTSLRAPINPGDIVMIQDCNARGVFQATNDPNANSGVLEHKIDNRTPGNMSEDIGYQYIGNVTSSGDNSLRGGAEVVPVQTVIYYLSKGAAPATGASAAVKQQYADKSPSLWRIVGNASPEELVEGVEKMQVAYGEQSGAGAIAYRKASAVTNWGNVVSINIALLVRSLSQYGTDQSQKTYDLLGSLGETIPAANDRHLRQVFATTITVRNDSN